ncbi:hypothetical protein M8C21_024633, partial [Ambrosia artemisiifolia]
SEDKIPDIGLEQLVVPEAVVIKDNPEGWHGNCHEGFGRCQLKIIKILMPSFQYASPNEASVYGN